jgi:hypothetical protein
MRFRLPRSLLLATLAATVFCCSKIPTPFAKSPGDVVKAFYDSANEGLYSEAEALLSESAKNAVHGELGSAGGGIKAVCDHNTRNGTIAAVEILKEDIRGEGATVLAKITYKDGSTNDHDRTQLIKEKGSWKITLGG